MHHLPKLFISIICLAILGYIFIFTPYPISWQQASTFQILAVFIPLLILFTLLIDLFLKYLPRSFIIGLGAVVIIVLQALNVLSLLLALEVLLVAILSARLFPKIKTTRIGNIPKLGLSKNSKGSTLPRFRRRHKR